jgi:hypothetical protein
VNIKEIPVKEARNAEMALLCGSPQDAEAILLTAGLIFRAIMLNIQLYNQTLSHNVVSSTPYHEQGTRLCIMKQYKYE